MYAKHIKTPTKTTPLTRLAHSSRFSFFYAVFSLVVLVSSTFYWALLSAGLQIHNADQLANSYLFSSIKTFQQATIPSQHTFLLKWPFIWLVKLLGNTNSAFTFVTVCLVLLTVGCLVYLLHRLEKRPLYFGTLCLALASVLLLIPAQPYNGALLPVNMAMLTTRNIEYIVFLSSMYLFAVSKRMRSMPFWSAVGLLSLVIASDKLFMIIGVGGAVLSLIAYALSSGWNLVRFSVNWLVGSLLASALGVGMLGLINRLRLTHISGDPSNAPFQFIHSLHDGVLGSFYALGSLFTNLGANPAFDGTELKKAPTQAVHRMASISGLSFLVNALLLGAGAFALYQLAKTSFKHNKNSRVLLGTDGKFSLALIWVSLAAIGGFIITHHYYPVDSRYITITLFALFIGGALWLRTSGLRPERVMQGGLVLALSILCALPMTSKIHAQQNQATNVYADRNSAILQILQQHPVKTLVGDYWRVLPTKLSSNNSLNITPLANCTEPRDMLSSQQWQPDLNTTSFAYILSFDNGPADFPHCSLDAIIEHYGRPSSSQIIAGSRINPQELLLFYDNGIINSAPQVVLKTPSTVLPITLDELPNTACNGLTIVNIVAHQDDDLLFMNPDTLHDIKTKRCVRTIYVTAGDAGAGKYYWLGRQRGAEAAYSNMLGSSAIWVERIVKLRDDAFITVANPRGEPSVSLIFMNIPDGNLKGEGFKVSGRQSLAKLQHGAIQRIGTIDGQSSYDSGQLVTSLADILHIYAPSEIRTQSSQSSPHFPDHSDHTATSNFAKEAYKLFEKVQYEDKVVIPLKFYVGYPIHDRPENLSVLDQTEKGSILFKYAQFDAGVCASLDSCKKHSVYDIYIKRQYQNAF